MSLDRLINEVQGMRDVLVLMIGVGAFFVISALIQHDDTDGDDD